MCGFKIYIGTSQAITKAQQLMYDLKPQKSAKYRQHLSQLATYKRLTEIKRK